MLPDLRAPLEGRTPRGVRVRLRPVASAGRWVADAWDAQGALLLGGRPVAVGSDLLCVLCAGEALRVSGDADPTALASLAAQGISIRAG